MKRTYMITGVILALLGAGMSVNFAAESPDPMAPRAEIRYVSPAPPYGLPQTIEDLENDPVTPEQLRLGKNLFFDTILSDDRTIACASCHRPDHGFASPDAKSPGVHGQVTLRNAPTLFNRALAKSFMWDGRIATLEEQVLNPIIDEREMGLPLEEAVSRLKQSTTYSQAFQLAYKNGVTQENLARALAGFTRRIWLGNSPVDHFVDGNVGHLSVEARTGMWIFESKGQCWRCHTPPSFADEDFHNTGVGVRNGVAEPGREAITKNPEDRGKFKTPTLRGLTLTPPYMHDGSLTTLEEVVEFYRKGGEPNPNLDRHIQPLDLSDDDARNLVEFLKALSITVDPPENQ